MKCWLCAKSISLGYIENPFQSDSKICSRCADCLESSFALKRPSAARLIHEIGHKTKLSSLQVEEHWLQYRRSIYKAISAAADIEDKEDAIEERLSALSMSWEEQPPHAEAFSSIEDELFWTLYHRLNEDAQSLLNKAVDRAVASNQALSSLHVLRSVLQGSPELVAHTALLLADFDPHQRFRSLVAKLIGLGHSTDSVQLTAELSKSLEQWLSSYHPPYLHSGCLLSAILKAESLAYGFLKETCDLTRLFELLSKLEPTY